MNEPAHQLFSFLSVCSLHLTVIYDSGAGDPGGADEEPALHPPLPGPGPPSPGRCPGIRFNISNLLRIKSGSHAFASEISTFAQS